MHKITDQDMRLTHLDASNLVKNIFGIDMNRLLALFYCPYLTSTSVLFGTWYEIQLTVVRLLEVTSGESYLNY